MTNKKITAKILRIIEDSQIAEITEHLVYAKLAKITKNQENRKILEQISKDELDHYEIWKAYTKKELKPNMAKVYFYYYLTRIFWLTFGLKLMESGEQWAQVNYDFLSKYAPEAIKIKEDEEKHELSLIDMINEKHMDYLGSIVLGLNDALVELTGVLAGLSLGLQDPDIVAVVGLITWVSASFSMAGSEYLSVKTDGGENPIRSATYTGIAYFSTVVLLIAPYFLIDNVFYALGTTLMVSILIIFMFNFYASISKWYNFKSRFFEMLAITLWVATISFFLGLGIRHFFGVEI